MCTRGVCVYVCVHFFTQCFVSSQMWYKSALGKKPIKSFYASPNHKSQILVLKEFLYSLYIKNTLVYLHWHRSDIPPRSWGWYWERFSQNFFTWIQSSMRAGIIQFWSLKCPKPLEHDSIHSEHSINTWMNGWTVCK